MKQSRLTSLFKSLVSTAVGFAVAFLANMIILPLFGLPLSTSANLLLTTIYTVISIGRGYALERVFEALGWRLRISPFASAVLFERQQHRDREGWDDAHDDAHLPGELATAGACYALHAQAHASLLANRVAHAVMPAAWPWSEAWWKPVGFRRDLVKAAALILAEGEKFDRSRKSHRIDRRPPVTDDSLSPRSPLVNQPTLARKKTPAEHAGTSG